MLFLITFISFDPVLSSPWEDGIILKGNICRMNEDSDVIEDSKILIKSQQILDILGPDEPISPGYENAVIIETEGYIYPGLIDLHNHPFYNVLPLWYVGRKYTTRYHRED